MKTTFLAVIKNILHLQKLAVSMSVSYYSWETDTNQHLRDVRRRIRSSSSRAEIALAFRVLRAHYLSLEHLRGLSGLHKYLRGI